MEVVEQLCLHCKPLKVLDEGDIEACYRRRRPCVASLASLCLTSKSLNSIAIRHLYHRPECEDWWLLAQTLVTRKDLARHVKYLYCLDWAYTSFPLKEPNDYYKKAWLLEHTDAIGDEARVILRSADTDASLNIMCGLCPNLETLVLTEDYYSGTEFWLLYLLPDSMVHLRHLDVRADPHDGFQVENFAPLFRAAPNLTSLRFTGADTWDDLHLTLNHVTRVDLEKSHLDIKSFGNLLRACPRLERLKYESCDPEGVEPPFTPREAKETILEHAPNIKSFDLAVFRCKYRSGRCVYMPHGQQTS
jgi:hypothetical protein